MGNGAFAPTSPVISGCPPRRYTFVAPDIVVRGLISVASRDVADVEVPGVVVDRGPADDDVLGLVGALAPVLTHVQPGYAPQSPPTKKVVNFGRRPTSK